MQPPGTVPRKASRKVDTLPSGVKTFYPKTRAQWRRWLEKNHARADEVWLVYYKKSSGKPRISYDDAVEEALCFGWIDGLQRGIDDERFAQRFTPRRKGSSWSEPNKQRLRRLIAAGQVTPAGLEAARDVKLNERLRIPKDIAVALRDDAEVWRNFRRFPLDYRKLRIAWIDGARARPEEFDKRLKHFIEMTRRGKTYGYVKP